MPRAKTWPADEALLARAPAIPLAAKLIQRGLVTLCLLQYDPLVYTDRTYIYGETQNGHGHLDSTKKRVCRLMTIVAHDAR